MQKGMHDGDGINLGFEGAKRKKAGECGGQECRLKIQMRPDTSPGSAAYQLSDLEPF